MEACLHYVPQRDTEREKGEDEVKRKVQDTMMESAERKCIPDIDKDKYPLCLTVTVECCILHRCKSGPVLSLFSDNL